MFRIANDNNKKLIMSDNPYAIKEETALEWLQRLKYDALYLRTGHMQFDCLKIIKCGDLIEIIGNDAVGKMQLAMTIIVEFLISDKLNPLIAVIDFNGSFRIERLKKILFNRKPNIGLDIENKNTLQQILNKISYCQAKSSTDLENCLLGLELLFQSSSSSTNSIIFLNKIGSILFDTVAKENFNGKLQKKFLDILKDICRKFGSTVIMTNHFVNWRGYSSPALGKNWINGISTRIILDRSETKRYAQTLINGDIQSDRIPFAITDKGFVENFNF